jgi:hypothetical protein
MHTTVTVGRIDHSAVNEISRIVTEFDSDASPGFGGLRRRQLYVYYDVLVHVQDFVGAGVAETGRDPGLIRFEEALSPLVTGYDQDIAISLLDASASRFYHWEGATAVRKQDGLHSTVIVNRVQDAVVPEVARLFAELDETDFPYQMGTRRRQLFTYHGVYFHIQDFELDNGSAVIDQAWKDADPRFVKICADLDPLVKKYDPASWRSTADQIANRFYRWEAST